MFPQTSLPSVIGEFNPDQRPATVAEDLVPDDVIHLRQGGIMPADVHISDGSLLVDQSALTGESAAVSVAPGDTAYAGALMRSGRRQKLKFACLSSFL